KDGTFSIPEGNLFPADGSAGRPEIYVMGCRNPYRIAVDPHTGYLYWGDVGPFRKWREKKERSVMTKLTRPAKPVSSVGLIFWERMKRSRIITSKQKKKVRALIRSGPSTSRPTTPAYGNCRPPNRHSSGTGDCLLNDFRWSERAVPLRWPDRFITAAISGKHPINSPGITMGNYSFMIS